MEIKTALEQQLFNGKNFHVIIYNKTVIRREINIGGTVR